MVTVNLNDDTSPIKTLELSIAQCLASHMKDYEDDFGDVLVFISDNKIKIKGPKTKNFRKCVRDCYILRHLTFGLKLI